MHRTLTIASLIAAGLVGASAAPRQGHLVLVGGGPTPATVFERALKLSGGRAAIVAVLPQTYPNDTIAGAAVEMWKQFHAREVEMVSRTDMAAARAMLDKATLIWMPGGFQGLMMKAIAGTPIPDQIRARFAAGVTIGGSSAGAAAASLTMIADETTPEGAGDTGNTIDGAAPEGAATDVGLGLWPQAIVSPHFSERRRMNRLVTIVQGHPDLFGVGIDEGTAVIVSRGEFEVVGRGTVTIIDSRTLKSQAGGAGKPMVRAPPSVRTLRPGTHFRFAPQ